VSDVGAVVATTVEHQQLRSDHFFRCQHPHRLAEQLALSGVREPGFVHGRSAVGHVEDDVDEVLAGVGFGQPVRISHFRLETRRRQRAQRFRQVALAQENVDVLGVADYPGPDAQGVGTADQERDLGGAQYLEGAPVVTVGSGFADAVDGG
jgi:hypothetical protein